MKRRLLNPDGPAKPRDQLGHQVTNSKLGKVAEPPGSRFTGQEKTSPESKLIYRLWRGR